MGELMTTFDVRIVKRERTQEQEEKRATESDIRKKYFQCDSNDCGRELYEFSNTKVSFCLKCTNFEDILYSIQNSQRTTELKQRAYEKAAFSSSIVGTGFTIFGIVILFTECRYGWTSQGAVNAYILLGFALVCFL